MIRQNIDYAVGLYVRLNKIFVIGGRLRGHWFSGNTRAQTS